jgi:hypothetical protein
MDTEIKYSYTDGYHTDVRKGELILDKSLYKNYCDIYNTQDSDSLDKLSRRLWFCHLRATGDYECKMFLKDIFTVCPYPELKELQDFLTHQIVQEITFELC